MNLTLNIIDGVTYLIKLTYNHTYNISQNLDGNRKGEILDIKQYTGNPIQAKVSIIIEMMHFRHRGPY